jgi:F-type H+-transporting ATPase subunit b
MATGAHTEVPGGKAPFPPFHSETFASQLLWLAISFGLLYLLIARIAIPRIGGIIAARSDRIAADLAEAEKLKGHSDEALAAYEKSLADARGRAQALAGETRDKLAAEAEQSRRALEAELNDRLTKAEGVIAGTKTAAMANVHGIAVDTAAAIVERLLGSTPGRPSVEAAVADVLKRRGAES